MEKYEPLTPDEDRAWERHKRMIDEQNRRKNFAPVRNNTEISSSKSTQTAREEPEHPTCRQAQKADGKSVPRINPRLSHWLNSRPVRT